MSPQAKQKAFTAFLFIYGLLCLAGVDAMIDFVQYIQWLGQGKSIDYSQLSDFCGYTGKKLPGESEEAYRIRSALNMAQAMAAMLVLSHTVGFFLMAILWLPFHIRYKRHGQALKNSIDIKKPKDQ